MSGDERRSGEHARTPLEAFLDLLATIVADDLARPTIVAAPIEKEGTMAGSAADAPGSRPQDSPAIPHHPDVPGA